MQKWRGDIYPARLGVAGLGYLSAKAMGVTPAGVHKIVGLLYRPDRIAKVDLPDWALPIGVNDIWSDDPTDPDYNLLCRAPHPFGHEKLRRSDPLYDMILLTNYNWPYAKAGAGSAIFLHVWRKARHPTAGCVAFAKSDLMWVAQRLRPASRVIIQL